MWEILNINGITFIFSPFRGMETASVGIFFKTGSRYEPQRLRGIAHFLEHMLFKGSREYSYKRIKQEIEGRGGTLNGFTSQEITGYYAHFLNKNLRPTLDILLDMVSSPLLNDDDVEKERRVILEEIKMYNDQPSSRVGILLDELLWENHPLGDEVIGYAPTVNRITKKDLRDFMFRFYRPGNMVVCCSGDFNRDQVIRLIQDKISGPRRVTLRAVRPDVLRGIKVKTEQKPLEQSYLCLGFRSSPYSSPDKFALQLLNVILGANMSSRLFEEVREKRALCYDVATEVRKYRDSGAFMVHLGLDKSKIRTALASILRELQKIKQKNVLVPELNRAKDYLLGQIIIGLEKPQGRMFYMAESFLHFGKIKTLAGIKKDVSGVTADQIRRVAEKIFDFNSMRASCVGALEQDAGERIKEIIRFHLK